MKAIKYSILSLLLITTPFAFYSCSDKESDDPPESTNDPTGKLKRMEDDYGASDFSYEDGLLKSITVTYPGRRTTYHLTYQNGKVSKLSVDDYDADILVNYSANSIWLTESTQPDVPLYSFTINGNDMETWTILSEGGFKLWEYLMTYTNGNAEKMAFVDYDEQGTLSDTFYYDITYLTAPSPLYFSSDVRACLYPIFGEGIQLFYMFPKNVFSSVTSYYETLTADYVFNDKGLPTEMLLDGETYLKFYYY